MGNKDNAHIYTVSELNRNVRDLLEVNFENIWVEGEISNFRAPSSGHFYFSLKDEKASLNAVMFRGYGSKLKFIPEDGMQVLCYGRISVYEKQGQYQVYIEKVEPKGVGSLHLAFEHLKEKLFKEGLFDEGSKKSIPFLPARIGVITSPTGAAVRDIIKVARRRYSDIEITLYPVKVQGEESKDNIAKGIKVMNEYNRWLAEEGSTEPSIDVIIVGRGGGSLEDLWAFNEEIVARAIFDSEIPVVSAVGHEIDFTISDFVADLRAATPSAAAEVVIPQKEELENRIDYIKKDINALVRNSISILEERVSDLSSSKVMAEPMGALLNLEQHLDDLIKGLDTSYGHGVESIDNKLRFLSGKLDVLGPESVLKRGFSITFKEGKVVKSASGLVKGDNVLTKFCDGEIESIIK